MAEFREGYNEIMVKSVTLCNVKDKSQSGYLIVRPRN